MRDNLDVIGAVAHEGNSGAIPAHEVGDIIVIGAVRAGSATAPTIPGGWTSISAGGNNSAIALSVAYKIAASDSEVSGTWTNAARIHILVIRGTYRTNPIGGQVTTTNNASPAAPTTPAGSYGTILTFQARRTVDIDEPIEGTAGDTLLISNGVDGRLRTFEQVLEAEDAGETVTFDGGGTYRTVRVHFAIPLEAGTVSLQSNQPTGVHLTATGQTGGSGARTRVWQRKVGAGAFADYTTGVLSEDEIWDWDVAEGETYTYRQRQVSGAETVFTNEVSALVASRATGSVIAENFDGFEHGDIALGVVPFPNANMWPHVVRVSGASGQGLAMRHLPTTTGSGHVKSQRYLPMGPHFEGEVLVRCAVQRRDDSNLSAYISFLVRSLPALSSYMLFRLTSSTITFWRQNPNNTRQTASYTMDTLRWEWVRIRYQGDNFKMRMWKDGEAEPGTWHIDNTDTHAVANETNGWFWLGGGNFVVRFYDYIAGIREGAGTVPVPDWASCAIREITSPEFGKLYDGSISMAWTAALDVDNYEIEVMSQDGDWEALAQPVTNSYSWNIASLPNGPYRVRIRGVKGAVEGPWVYVDTFYIDHEEAATRLDPQPLSVGTIADIEAAGLEHMFNFSPAISIVELSTWLAEGLREGRKVFRLASAGSGSPWGTGVRLRDQRWWDHADWVARVLNLTQSTSGDQVFTGGGIRGIPGSSVAARIGYAIGHHPTNSYSFYQLDGEQLFDSLLPNFSSQVEQWARHRGQFRPDGFVGLKMWLEMEVEPDWRVTDIRDEPSLGGWFGFGEFRGLGNASIHVLTVLPLGTLLTPPEIQGPDEGSFIKGPNVPVTWTESVNRVED